MIIQDDRSTEQKQTHTLAIVARDKFMSGWGEATGGVSRCAWACAQDANISRLENWVRNRKEMIYVTVVDLSTYRPPKGTAHFHIYVADSAWTETL